MKDEGGGMKKKGGVFMCLAATCLLLAACGSQTAQISTLMPTSMPSPTPTETATPTEIPVPAEIKDFVSGLPPEFVLYAKASLEANSYVLLSAPVGEEEMVLGQFSQGTEGWTLQIKPSQGDPIQANISDVTVDAENQRIRVEDQVYDVLNLQYTREKGWQRYLDIDKVQLLTNEDGNPVSTRIEDEQEDNFHVYYLFPVIVSDPVLSKEDGLWRVKVWNSAGSTPNEYGHILTIVLGHDKGNIAVQKLPDMINSGQVTYITVRVVNLVKALRIGDQTRFGIIGEHSLTAKGLSDVRRNGYEYPDLLEGYEDENVAILDSLQSEGAIIEGEIRGFSSIRIGKRNE